MGAACVVAGQILFAAGVWSASWTVMLAGRILFGIGGESVQVAQNCLLFRWFKCREVAFALGLNLSVARSGSVLNDVLSPWASQRWGVMGSLWLGVVLCAMGFGTPPFGIIVDVFGMRSRFLLLSSLLLAASYAMIFTVSPFISMFCLGMVYMVFAGALWPAFALTVPQKELGSAYGIATALQNTGLAIMPLLVGVLQTEPTHGSQFVNVIRLFILLGFISVVVAALICHVNAATRGVLELPSSEADSCAKNDEKAPLHDQMALKHGQVA